MDTQIITTITNAIVNTFTSMLTPNMGYLVIGSLMLTQAVKWIVIYCHKDLPKQLIWFVVSPAITCMLSHVIWKYDNDVHWVAAALTASLFSNLAYTLFLKKIMGNTAPETYRRINIPVDRRKNNTGKILNERRKK